jgi:D-serine deaminase-like pyridoxal phosphate-dependent protein
LPGVTEVQAGGGIFGDRRCREVSRVDMRCALTLMATITSRPDPRRIVCDSGKKSMSDDMPGPRARGMSDVAGLKLSAEHATLTLTRPSDLPVGSRVVFEVGYSDSTIHLHDEMHGLRGDGVEVTWNVGARCKMK